MQNKNSTTCKPFVCAVTKWLRGLFPLLILSTLWLPGQLSAAGPGPNCSNSSPHIDENGDIWMSAQDFVTNTALLVEYPLTIKIKNAWGGDLNTFTYNDAADAAVAQSWNVCNYLGKSLSFTASNSEGECTKGWLDLNGTPKPKMVSALQDGIAPYMAKNKMVVYCGKIPDAEEYVPEVISPCDRYTTQPKAQPDWPKMPANRNCGQNDTVEVLWRTWEIFDVYGNMSTMVDTIVVIRLPKLSPDHFVGTKSKSVFCALETVRDDESMNIEYNAWKQPTGKADYERPFSKLRAFTYDLPAEIIEEGCIRAAACGSTAAYLEQVIMIRANGDEVTIEDILSGQYIIDVLARATPEQKSYGILELIYQGGLTLASACGYTYAPYLFPQMGDQLLSEEGGFVTVTAEWFYNGNAQDPFWFAGAWPFVCENAGCYSFRDGMPVGLEEDCLIHVMVPQLTADAGSVTPFLSGECDTICLSEGTHCGITIDAGGMQEVGACPYYIGGHLKLTQYCWAKNGNNICHSDSDFVDDPEEFDNDGDGEPDKQLFNIYRKTYFVDTLPPIFDFCYLPDCGEESEVRGLVAEGIQPDCARQWEEEHPAVFSNGSHECFANVAVPEVRLLDGCSQVRQVKATILGQEVGLILVRTEGDWGVWANPGKWVRVPFNDCDSDPEEVLYEALDVCNNKSTWRKYIKVTDQIRPVAVADRNNNVSINGLLSTVAATDYDEGSWDNCAIDITLARRADWLEAYMDICDKITGTPATWSQIFAQLGWQMDGTIDISRLQQLLAGGAVGDYYAGQILALYYSTSAGKEKVLHGWLFDMALYIAGNCITPDPTLNIQSLKQYIDQIFSTGYGNELSYLGGGWVTDVPFLCPDAFEDPIRTDLLVMDYCQNWNIDWTNTHVLDLTHPVLVEELSDLTISCEAINMYYKTLLTEAAGYTEDGGSAAPGASGVFGDLDLAFGTYIQTVQDISGGFVEPDPSDLTFEYNTVICDENEAEETVLVTQSLNGENGIISHACSGFIRQDVTFDLSDCGQGEIIRRFYIGNNGGSSGGGSSVLVQKITVVSACEMKESMFDVPPQKGTAADPVCLAELLSESYFPDSLGALMMKPHLAGGELCNNIFIGYDVTKLDMDRYPGLILYDITWTATDWCCNRELWDGKLEFTQKIIAKTDPACAEDDLGGNGLVRGEIATEIGTAVKDVEVRVVMGDGSPMTLRTDSDGRYSFSVDRNWQLSLIPDKNNGFSEGITTLDLIDIQKHILGKKSLDGKYRKIAADVNRNGKIDAFDITELRKLILNPEGEFNKNTSWRFFDKNADKEVLDLAGLKGEVTADWIAVKIGDVNMSAGVTSSGRNQNQPVHLNMSGKTMKPGETFEVAVTSDNFSEITGFQYTLSYQNHQVEIESIRPGALNITEGHYLKYAPGSITMSWQNASGLSLDKEEILFTLVMKAKASASLRDVLSLTDRVVAVESYDVMGETKGVALRFDQSDFGFALYQNTPNPYSGSTSIGFELPEAGRAALSIYDVNGRLLKLVEGEYDRGYHELTIRTEDLNTTGILYYQLDTKDFVATKKMIVIE